MDMCPSLFRSIFFVSFKYATPGGRELQGGDTRRKIIFNFSTSLVRPLFSILNTEAKDVRNMQSALDRRQAIPGSPVDRVRSPVANLMTDQRQQKYDPARYRNTELFPHDLRSGNAAASVSGTVLVGRRF